VRRIVDVGGGRGDLAVLVAQAFPAVHVTVIDINESSLLHGQRQAARAGLRNITFLLQDIREFEGGAGARPAGSSETEGGQGGGGQGGGGGSAASADLFIGLHCCGGLSDATLRAAARLGASFLVCSCCFCKHMELAEADADAAQPGTGTAASAGAESAVWGLPTEERALLCRLADTDPHSFPDPATSAMTALAMRTVNSLRLRAARAHFCGSGSGREASDEGEGGAGAARLECSLRAFPAAYSQKNVVLHGVAMIS
jgi:hypothetical protein